MRGSMVGTSYTDYGGRGFWAREGSGAVFLGGVDTRPLRAFTIGVVDLMRARPTGDVY